MLEQEINLVQIPHPGKATFKFPPFPVHDAQSNPRGISRGRGGVEASIGPVHNRTKLNRTFD